MDESFSRAYFESSLKRTGDFSWVVDGPVIKPFPVLCLAGVIVFLPSASYPTTGSSSVLGFLGIRPCFSGNFLFMDGLDEPVTIGTWPPTSFFFAAFCFMTALLLAASISTQG